MTTENAKKLAILLLGFAGGYLETDTRLQKIAFILEEEVFKDWAKFEPNDYGPYSKELAKALKELEKEGKIIHVIDEVGLSKYYLTDDGRKQFNELLKSINPNDIAKAEEIVERHKDDALSYLIAYVYANYPQYAVKSKIIDKVYEWRRYYGI
jgi:uncharacterized protein YwgA